jgi:hypothetical protein
MIFLIIIVIFALLLVSFIYFKADERTYVVTIFNGDRGYYKGKKLHREDGPAIERTDGTQEWRVNGKRHRLDGPAVEKETSSGSYQEWWVNGKRHRLDGPAIVNGKYDSHYYVCGKEYDYNSFVQYNLKQNLKKQMKEKS